MLTRSCKAASVVLLALLLACPGQGSDSRAGGTLEVSRGRRIAARAVEAELSADIVNGADRLASVLAAAPRLAELLDARCPPLRCTAVRLVPLFPAGEGLVAEARVRADDAEIALSEVYLDPSSEPWTVTDEVPPEIEGTQSQLAVDGEVVIDPETAHIEVDATIDILSGGQRYLLFDFLAEGAPDAELFIRSITQDDLACRFVRSGALLVVELARLEGQAQLRFRYHGTLRKALDSYIEPSRFLLVQAWIPYLGGAADWRLSLVVPEGFAIGAPAAAGAAGPRSPRQGFSTHTLLGTDLDRLPVVAARAYHVLPFDHEGTRFEIWLETEHAERAPAVRDAVFAALEAFSGIGPFPGREYRIVQAQYGSGHGALGLRDLMILGEELLAPEHLQQTIAHELAHTWFAGHVRDTSGRWSEAVASYLSLWPLDDDSARRTRWSWIVAYEQVPHRRDVALDGDGPMPSDPGLVDAIFYGKGALVLQELESRVGRKKMIQILSLFVYQYRGLDASWSELQQSIADVVGSEEARRLGHWLGSTGGRDLKFSDLERKGRRIMGSLHEHGVAVRGSVEVGFLGEQGQTLSEHTLMMDGKRVGFDLPIPRGARWLAVDPDYTMPRASELDGRPRWMVRIDGTSL